MADERRHHNRLGLSLPVRVQGYLATGETWAEFSTTIDVPSAGACFPLQHEVRLGQVLRLSLAMPKRLRQYDLNDSSYHVYTLVRGVYRANHEPRVGVMFFGKYPPRGFHEQPTTRYLLPEDSVAAAPVPHGLREAKDAPGAEPAAAAAPGANEIEPFAPSRGERRQGPRVDVFVNFTLRQLDATGAVLQEELTVADNLSRGGARVMSSLAFHPGDVVVLREAGGEFETRAEIRAITRVQPSVDRLHLRFVEAETPERLLRL